MSQQTSTSPAWDKFMDEVFPGEPEKEKLFQRYFGAELAPPELVVFRHGFIRKVLRSVLSKSAELLQAFCLLMFCLFFLPFVPHFLIFARFKFRSDLRYFIRKFATAKKRPERHPEIYEKFIEKAQHNVDHFWSLKWESYLD